MPLYIGDYLRDTMGLSRSEHGSYLLLILAYWANSGPLPSDDEMLREVAKCPMQEWSRTKGIMLRFFKAENGHWRHKRIDEELSNARETYEHRLSASRKANATRWGSAIRTVSESESVTQSESESAAVPQPQPQPQPPLQAQPIEKRETGVAAFPEVPPMQRKDWDALCGIRGWPDDFRDWVWNDLESTNWINRAGAQVTNLEAHARKVFPSWRKVDAGNKPKQGPTLAEVQDVCREKWGDDHRHSHWAASFYSFWNKKAWKRGDKPIDWRDELSKQLSKWRTQNDWGKQP